MYDVTYNTCTLPGLHGPSVRRISLRNPVMRLFGTSAAPPVLRSCAPLHPGKETFNKTSCNVKNILIIEIHISDSAPLYKVVNNNKKIIV